MELVVASVMMQLVALLAYMAGTELSLGCCNRFSGLLFVLEKM